MKSTRNAHSERLSRQTQRDTLPELRLRRALFARGLRYRVDYRAGPNTRRIDIAFPGRRVAVFMDGCFWHSCPVHGTAPKANSEWWRAKLERNVARDKSSTVHLESDGWAVLRFWEHDDPNLAADEVARIIGTRGRA